jgi:hypothetical protein
LWRCPFFSFLLGIERRIVQCCSFVLSRSWIIMIFSLDNDLIAMKTEYILCLYENASLPFCHNNWIAFITMLPSDSTKVSTPPLSISKSKDFLVIYIKCLKGKNNNYLVMEFIIKKTQRLSYKMFSYLENVNCIFIVIVYIFSDSKIFSL